MNFILQPWQLYFLIIAGWINPEQQEVIEYLRRREPSAQGEDRKEAHPASDDQRRRLAVKGKVLGRKMLTKRLVPCLHLTRSYAGTEH